MPNWTRNIMHVDGDVKEVKKFLKHMGKQMDFQKVLPMPEDCFTDNLGDKERKMCEDQGIPNWYDWSIENWGTKWNANNVEGDVEVDKYGKKAQFLHLTYRFETAWDTPREVIRALFKQWPELEFDGGYIHEGYEGCGNFNEFSKG
jgi:hypothetical protein|tara:strand:+ start:1076 stop:1513 length:438 start_codon:yes stop_codon:yes gene_type:complete